MFCGWVNRDYSADTSSSFDCFSFDFTSNLCDLVPKVRLDIENVHWKFVYATMCLIFHWMSTLVGPATCIYGSHYSTTRMGDTSFYAQTFCVPWCIYFYVYYLRKMYSWDSKCARLPGCLGEEQYLIWSNQYRQGCQNVYHMRTYNIMHFWLLQ